MFTYTTTVKLHDTDAAGLLFFGHQFTIAHDAYELFLESIGFGLAHVIRESDFLLAIVRAEADFRQPVFVGDKLNVHLNLERIGETSFTLTYDLVGADGEDIGAVKTVHVCLDKSKRTKRTLPNGLRAALTPHR